MPTMPGLTGQAVSPWSVRSSYHANTIRLGLGCPPGWAVAQNGHSRCWVIANGSVYGIASLLAAVTVILPGLGITLSGYGGA